MATCPICRRPMRTDDVNDANFVALGRVVCNWDCYQVAYALETDVDGEPFQPELFGQPEKA